MSIELIEELFDVVRRKYTIDQKGTWSNGSSTYLSAMKAEIQEVEDELQQDRICFIEDELGDILWDYLHVLNCLEHEKGIDISSVVKRALKKYDERISGIENNTSWTKIKRLQKGRLEEEYKLQLKIK